MTEFENIAVGRSSVPALIITIILMIAIPVAFFVCWRRKHKQQTNISYLVAGAVGFIMRICRREMKPPTNAGDRMERISKYMAKDGLYG